jgi:hypothetical protein
VKAEKYLIVTESSAPALPIVSKVRFGFGAAGEEVQKLLTTGVERVRVRIDGTALETVFASARPWRLLDIKQRIKGLSATDD